MRQQAMQRVVDSVGTYRVLRTKGPPQNGVCSPKEEVSVNDLADSMGKVKASDLYDEPALFTQRLQ